MLELSCPKCGSQYDYFNKTATVICANNHVICRLCAISIKQNSGFCPNCYIPILGAQNQNAQRQQIQGFNNSPYWQPNQAQEFQNNINPVNNYQNQGFQPQPPLPFRKQRSGIFCGLSFVFLIVFIVLLVIQILMDPFDPGQPGVMFGLFISFFLSVSFFMSFSIRRRRNQMIQGLALGEEANYRRI